MPNNPGDPLNTGTGGFPVNNDDRYTYDVGTTEGDETPRPKWNSGQINVDQTQKDLSKGTKRTLGSYLSNTTLGKTPSAPSPVQNKYPVNHAPTEDPVDLKLQDESGYPQQLTQIQDRQEHFANVPLGRSDDSSSLNMLRGRQQPSGIGSQLAVDGNDLLRSKENPALPSQPALKYSASVVGRNRFNQGDTSYEKQASPDYDPSNPERGEFKRPSDNYPQFALKYNMGTSTANRDVTFARLAQIGNSLSVRSGFELNSFEPGNNPTSPTSEAAALLPGWTQLGVNKIGRDRLTAKSVLEDLTDQGIDGSLLIDPAGTSWGNLNNVNDQFAGISNFGMQLLAVALIVALVTAVAVTSALFLTNTSSMAAADEDGRRPFGASLYDDSTAVDYNNILSVLGNLAGFNFWRMLGVPPTKNSLSECLTVGALSFFGINDTTNVGRAVLQGATSVTQSAGYYSIIAREVNRSFLLIGESFKTLGRAFSSGRTAAGIGQLFGVIETLRNSKFLRVVSIFSRQGDKIIRDNSMPIEKLVDPKSRGASTRYFSDIDRLPNRGYSGKGRLTGQTAVSPLTLSWASYRASDLFLMPASYASLVYKSTAMDPPNLFPSIPENGEDGDQGGVRANTFSAVSEDKNRIDTPVREAMEADLESEYVPFYIHDVRTNEIISFHAFLASLTEDYSAAYDTAEAMGRVDPIKIYKSTVRKIGFSFYIAATNDRDFDSMWMKINKLTTLVYPQFSRGDFLSANQTNPGQQQLVMPFSQVIQAPPMVRVRIGDLIRSNYSKFNLARLFGYGDPNVDIDNVGKMPRDVGPDSAQSAYLNTLKSSALGRTFTTRHPLSRPSTKDNIFGISIATSAPQEGIALPQGLVLKVEKFDEAKGECTVTVQKGTSEDTGMTQAALDAVEKLYETKTAGNDRAIVGKSYIFNISQLTPTPSTSAFIVSKGGEDMRGYADKMSNFMIDDPENNSNGNAIAKSFRSSGGKGLAGFIESMAFDWYDRVTWETEMGRKAPKICKVTISFSPVHDITPGLDHRGVNRAPIYPVISKRSPPKAAK